MVVAVKCCLTLTFLYLQRFVGRITDYYNNVVDNAASSAVLIDDTNLSHADRSLLAAVVLT